MRVGGEEVVRDVGIDMGADAASLSTAQKFMRRRAKRALGESAISFEDPDPSVDHLSILIQRDRQDVDVPRWRAFAHPPTPSATPIALSLTK